MIKSGKVSPLKWGYVWLHGVLTSCSTATKKFNRKHWRIHYRLLTIFKKSNKSVWSNVFWYVKVCIFWKCIRYTIHWDKTQLLKKFPLDKISGTKIPSFFCELQVITVLVLICGFYMSWYTRFISLKLCVGFSIFDSVSLLLKFIYLFNKKHVLFDFKTW